MAGRKQQPWTHPATPTHQASDPAAQQVCKCLRAPAQHARERCVSMCRSAELAMLLYAQILWQPTCLSGSCLRRCTGPLSAMRGHAQRCRVKLHELQLSSSIQHLHSFACACCLWRGHVGSGRGSCAAYGTKARQPHADWNALTRCTRCGATGGVAHFRPAQQARSPKQGALPAHSAVLRWLSTVRKGPKIRTLSPAGRLLDPGAHSLARRRQPLWGARVHDARSASSG